MNTPTTIRFLRPALIGWGVAFLILAVGLARTPLFDLLGYEFSLAFTLPASLAGVHLAARLVAAHRRGATPSQQALANVHPLCRLIRLLFDASVSLLLLLLLPLVVISLNTVRVRNCNFSAGMAWFALLPVLSGLLGCAVGLLSGLLAPRGKWTLALGYLFIAASLSIGVWRFYAAPPIFAYDPFVGYFAGSLYDEAVRPTTPLLYSRLYQLTSALFGLAAAALLLDGHPFRLRGRSARARAPLMLLSLALLTVAGGLFVHRSALGFALDATDIARALGAERRTRHFVLHYSQGGPFAKDIDLYAQEHEFRYEELRRLFGVEPTGTVHSYLFNSAAQKQALMGAAHTYIAKPWRREIYLQHEAWPHSVLKHELAHVFAGAFGDPLFGTARKDIRINVGLIEGVAEAAAWHASPLSPHQSVKVLRLAGRSPDLERTLRPDGFFGLGPASAYAVVGSFCRFLLDTRGIERLRALYRSGGGPDDYLRIYGQPLSALGAEWARLVDTVHLSPEEEGEGKPRLFRPSIFRRTCAHELALRAEQARQALERGERREARQLLESLCRDEPDDPAHLEALMNALRPAPHTELIAVAEKILTHPKASDAQRMAADQLLGDLDWETGRREEAVRHYQTAAAYRVDAATQRLLRVKTILVQANLGSLGEPLRRIYAPVSGDKDAALDLFQLSEASHAQPQNGLLHYLFARQLDLRSRSAEAAVELERALSMGLPDQHFVEEATRLLGVDYFRQRAFSEAIRTFERLSQEASSESLRLEAADWAARSRYFQSPGSSG